MHEVSLSAKFCGAQQEKPVNLHLWRPQLRNVDVHHLDNKNPCGILVKKLNLEVIKKVPKQQSKKLYIF